MGEALRDTIDLALLEAPGGDGIFNSDGTVNVVLIRPCNGRGPGARVYTRELLEAAAPMFSGWGSYLNHPDTAGPRSRMRRGPDELAGEIRESRWDPSFRGRDDAVRGYERGAVIGRFMPASRMVEQLLERIPSQLKLSIRAQATKLRPTRGADGSRRMLVEGIENDPENSGFDLVTAAGAGGEVLALLEAAPDTTRRDRTMKLSEALRSAEFSTLVREQVEGAVDDVVRSRRPEPLTGRQRLQAARAWSPQRVTEGQRVGLQLLESNRDTPVPERVLDETLTDEEREAAEQDRRLQEALPAHHVMKHAALGDGQAGGLARTMPRRRRALGFYNAMASRMMDPTKFGMPAQPPAVLLHRALQEAPPAREDTLRACRESVEARLGGDAA
jgi:hypothetical protein